MTESNNISFYESHQGFDILRVRNNGHTNFKMRGACGCYSTPEICKKVIDTYMERTGQWEEEKAPEAKVITIGRASPAEYSNKKHG